MNLTSINPFFLFSIFVLSRFVSVAAAPRNDKGKGKMKVDESEEQSKSAEFITNSQEEIIVSMKLKGKEPADSKTVGLGLVEEKLIDEVTLRDQSSASVKAQIKRLYEAVAKDGQTNMLATLRLLAIHYLTFGLIDRGEEEELGPYYEALGFENTFGLMVMCARYSHKAILKEAVDALNYETIVKEVRKHQANVERINKIINKKPAKLASSKSETLADIDKKSKILVTANKQSKNSASGSGKSEKLVGDLSFRQFLEKSPLLVANIKMMTEAYCKATLGVKDDDVVSCLNQAALATGNNRIPSDWDEDETNFINSIPSWDQPANRLEFALETLIKLVTSLRVIEGKECRKLKLAVLALKYTSLALLDKGLKLRDLRVGQAFKGEIENSLDEHKFVTKIKHQPLKRGKKTTGCQYVAGTSFGDFLKNGHPSLNDIRKDLRPYQWAVKNDAADDIDHQERNLAMEKLRKKMAGSFNIGSKKVATQPDPRLTEDIERPTPLQPIENDHEERGSAIPESNDEPSSSKGSRRRKHRR